MPYSKRQIVEIFFDLKQGSELHPGIILSVEDVYNAEGYYICVMISSIGKSDIYSFPLMNEDTQRPLKNNSQVRTHLIFQIQDQDINKDYPRNFLDHDTFLRLVDHIDENVFGIPFEL